MRVRLFKQSRNRAAQYTLINCCFHHLFQVLNNVLKIIIFSLSLCSKQTLQVVFTSASINNMPLQSEIYEIKQSAHPDVLPYIIIHLNSKQCFDTASWAAGRASGLCVVQLMPMPSTKPHHLLPHLNPDWLNLSGTGLPNLS